MMAGPERAMNDVDFGKWRPMASAPKNGSRILVAVRATEQGPAEVDVARWAKPDRWGEECWIAADSDPGCVIIYAEPELISWMPMPTPLAPLRSGVATQPRPKAPTAAEIEEIGGSGI
jgi:hypothetical protein